MSSIDTGLSALRAQQVALATLGNNITNAATPGYHRQRVELVDRLPVTQGGLSIGTGVSVAQIRRLRSEAIEGALLSSQSELSAQEIAVDLARQIESRFTPGEGSIQTRLSEFFNRLEVLANVPGEVTYARQVIADANGLMQEFNALHRDLGQLRTATQTQLQSRVDQLNASLAGIAELNQAIALARGNGREPNDLLDRRDQLLMQVATTIDVRIDTQSNGRDLVSLAGGAVLVGEGAPQLSLKQQSDGTFVLIREPGSSPLPITSGGLQGLLEGLNQTLPEAQRWVAEFAAVLVQQVDQVHAQGVPASGPLAVLSGERPVADVHAPLGGGGTTFAVQAGELTITTTNATTGVSRSQRIAFDPAVDSLVDLAARLDALEGVVAIVNLQERRLVLSGAPGERIDFAGGLGSQPDLTAFTGTTRPTVGGVYQGSTNETWRVEFSGGGEVGVTPGLTLRLFNQGGDLLSTHDVGPGYEVGRDLELPLGVRLQLTAGTVSAGETIGLLVTAQSDTTGLLSALGLGTLFTGSQIGDWRVREGLVARPLELAVSQSGTELEARNAARLAGLRDLRLPELGGRTFVEELADFTALTGDRLLQREESRGHISSLQERLVADRNAVSGVDPNEEMVEMLEVQRAYQAAARFLATVDETLDAILSLAR